MLSDLPKLVLDPANEGDLAALSYDRIKIASGNVLSDFRAGSVLAALVEGQVFALAELLYYLNLMPEAIAIEVFRLHGVARRMGTAASGGVTFRLGQASSSGYSLPAGYEVAYLDSKLVLLEALFIAAGAAEATVAARMADVGAKYNIEPFGLLANNVGLGGIEAVFNRLAFTGGSDLESIESLIRRCQASVVARDTVITQLDYELAAQKVLGTGSRAVAVPNLAGDGSTYQQAAVAVFLLDSLGQPANPTTCQQVAADLKDRILLGTGVACLPSVLIAIDIEVQINVSDLSEAVAAEAITAIADYLRPNSYSDGAIVRHNEIGYVARGARGVLSVDSVLINGEAIDYVLAQDWHYPSPRMIAINQMDAKERILNTTKFFGDDDLLAEDD